MILFGVAVSSLFMPVVLDLLNSAYGFAGLGDDDDDGSSGALPAPQASLMASVALGIVHGGLPWGWVAAGAATALAVIAADAALARKAVPFSLPVLGFAVGFYLPLSTGVAILMGALVGVAAGADPSDETSDGVLFAGGLITGEALTGIVLAVPIVVSGDPDVLRILSGDGLWYVAVLLSALVLGALYRVSRKPASTRGLYSTNCGITVDEDAVSHPQVMLRAMDTLSKDLSSSSSSMK